MQMINKQSNSNDSFGPNDNDENQELNFLRQQVSILEERFLQTVTFMDHLPVVALVLNTDKQIVWYNKPTKSILQFENKTLTNKYIYDIFNIKRDTFFYEKIWETVLDIGSWQGQITYLDDRGGEVHQWARVFKLLSKDQNNIKIGVILSEFADLSVLNQQITNLSYYDQMTGLGNMRLFEDNVKEIISDNNINHAHIIYVQMKGLHKINLTYGYDIGDKVILEAVARMNQFVSATFKVYRVVGDVFAIISLLDKNDLTFSNRFIRLTNITNAPYNIDGHELLLNVQFGVATYPTDAKTLVKLIQNAEMALNYAVENKQRFYFYSPSLNEMLGRNLLVAERLRIAIKEDLLEMYYQPIIATRNTKIVSAESLLRWNDQVLGYISPVEVINNAEINGLMRPLGLWIIENVFKNNLHERIHVSINITFSQLEDTLFVHQIRKLKKEYKIKDHWITFEIVEHQALDNSVLAKQSLKALVEMGFDIALDDFGTGHSSLSLVQQLPLKVLKVDGSFIKNIHESPQQTAIVRSTIELARNLEYFVVCEGVETVEEADFVTSLGTDFLQGYYYYKPMSLNELEKILDNQMLN